MDRSALTRTVRGLWDDDILPSLSDLVALPAVSPAFDPAWAEHGHLAAAVEHVRAWLATRDLPGVAIEVVRLPGRTPLLLVDVPATAATGDTVLLYGHLDKQPPVANWSEGLGPWTPVVRDGRLYGRGAADDGYSGYAAVAAVEAVRAAGGEHARCVVLLETGEESGSPDLPAYLEHLRPRLGEVSLVVCLDSGGSDYDRMWLTTSLRGLAQVTMTVRVLGSGLHSGMSSGIVPSSFRVARQLLDRLEDSATGELLVPEMHVEVPANRLAEVRAAVASAPGALTDPVPWAPGVRPVADDEVELALNAGWRPTLSVTGADGLPAPDDAGNVLRPFTTLVLSFRLPPTADAAAAVEAVRRLVTTDVPYGAVVELSRVEHADGWNAPDLAPWLRATLDRVGEEVFGAPWRTVSLGGSIPFMSLLHEAYPDAQFLVTGVVGPDSNCHVPDEWLHLAHAARVTEAVALVLDAHTRK
ncbi:M20/M25/M40 family metallo-hydrolase [Saccharothrix algeriensis]|uniref:Acetylornithine deacetylase/succinyl-diaminopimelate desuccinylase-like protein n=1 Tax=Saccharothrix algeriensis TaxID=173560 RepID=A0A8T8HR54_9PSEU|nr:M20/M25/M40 family metallo-hydrolase [Saccharothrix algeriensis]MBM7812302.1 acetylornithine deacetylase/succinyl-diaminopimelate desuccinylase-like protein [Saccharothrix algeriensis]QTR01082.1 M20/M25/M40 family metallo-hydrolase [Saccharothrix algeriensis]